MIATCNCEHEYQDESYGPGRRVHNKTTKRVGEASVYRCTVCGAEKTN